jgi:hypothetical protein
MALSTSQRFTLKKRIMDMLGELPHRDVVLAIEEFGLHDPPNWSNTEDLVAQAVRGTDTDTAIEGLYETLLEHEREGQPPMTEFIEDEDNKPFTSAEQQRIVEVLEGIKRQAAKEHELDEHQLRMLTGIFDSLSESARHDSRNTWLVMAISVVSGPIVSAIITPEGVHKVLTAMQAGLGPLFGHPMPLLGP